MTDRLPHASPSTPDGYRRAACGILFAAPQSFARHRIGTPIGRRCRTAVELCAAGIGRTAPAGHTGEPTASGP